MNNNNDNKPAKASAAANLMQLMSFTADKTLEMANANSVMGEITEIDGMLIIPVSKVSAGFAGGGANIVNVDAKKSNTPSGSGAKVTVTPMSFLVIKDGEVTAVNICAPAEASKKSIVTKIIDAVKGMKKNKKKEVTVEETK